MAIVMLSLYMIVITLIFLNVLIAMFSEGEGLKIRMYNACIMHFEVITFGKPFEIAWVKIKNIAAIHQSIFYWDVISEMR